MVTAARKPAFLIALEIDMLFREIGSLKELLSDILFARWSRSRFVSFCRVILHLNLPMTLYLPSYHSSRDGGKGGRRNGTGGNNMDNAAGSYEPHYQQQYHQRPASEGFFSNFVGGAM